MEKKLHLKVDNIEFVGSLMPSEIIPSIQLIKNKERALDGTLHVDIVASKRKLQIVFDMLDNNTFEQVMDIFETEDIEKINADGIMVEYYDLRDKSKEERRFIVDDISFMPFILTNEIRWKDVSVVLIEI